MLCFMDGARCSLLPKTSTGWGLPEIEHDQNKCDFMPAAYIHVEQFKKRRHLFRMAIIGDDGTEAMKEQSYMFTFAYGPSFSLFCFLILVITDPGC